MSRYSKSLHLPACDFRRLKSGVRLSKNLFGWFGGPQPSKCNPNPATCAADSEALRSKVSLHCFPPGRLIEPRGKQCKYSEKDAAGGLFRHAAPPPVYPAGGYLMWRLAQLGFLRTVLNNRNPIFCSLGNFCLSYLCTKNRELPPQTGRGILSPRHR